VITRAGATVLTIIDRELAWVRRDDQKLMISPGPCARYRSEYRLPRRPPLGAVFLDEITRIQTLFSDALGWRTGDREHLIAKSKPMRNTFSQWVTVRRNVQSLNHLIDKHRDTQSVISDRQQEFSATPVATACRCSGSAAASRIADAHPAVPHTGSVARRWLMGSPVILDGRKQSTRPLSRLGDANVAAGGLLTPRR